jgi:hypothetical protein
VTVDDKFSHPHQELSSKDPLAVVIRIKDRRRIFKNSVIKKQRGTRSDQLAGWIDGAVIIGMPELGRFPMTEDRVTLLKYLRPVFASLPARMKA